MDIPSTMVAALNTANLKRWIRKGNRLSILVTGRTGAGKSSLINGVIGEDIAEEGGIEVCSGAGVTKVVTPYHRKKHDIPVTVIDSPGFQDLDADQLSDDHILSDIKIKLTEATGGHVDVVLYCVKMTSNRLDSSDTTAMKHLSEQFPGIWDKTVFVLTYANEFRVKKGQSQTPDDKAMAFKAGIDNLRKAIMNALEKAGQLPPEGIIVVPAGYYEASDQDINPDDQWHLPGYEDDWLSTLWSECAAKLRGEPQLAMVGMASHRFLQAEDAESVSKNQRNSQRPIIVSDNNTFKLVVSMMTQTAMAGAKVGSALGQSFGPVGAAVGGACGTFVGGVAGAVCGGGILVYLKFWS